MLRSSESQSARPSVHESRSQLSFSSRLDQASRGASFAANSSLSAALSTALPRPKGKVCAGALGTLLSVVALSCWGTDAIGVRYAEAFGGTLWPILFWKHLANGTISLVAGQGHTQCTHHTPCAARCERRTLGCAPSVP